MGTEQEVEIEDVEADVEQYQHQEIVQPTDLHSGSLTLLTILITDTGEVRINNCLGSPLTKPEPRVQMFHSIQTEVITSEGFLPHFISSVYL